LFARYRPSALVVSEDGISGDLRLIAAAKLSGLKVLDVPYGYGFDREIEIALETKARDGWLETFQSTDWKILRWLLQKWVRKHGRYRGVTILPPAHILALESLGIGLRDPWSIHGGDSDWLCAESSIAKARYIERGIPERKIRLTGSPYCDQLLQAARERPEVFSSLRKPQMINPQGPMRLLVSWPPSYHSDRGEYNEYPSYEIMTQDIMSFLQSLPHTTLTVSLHPATDDNVKVLLRDLGVPVSDEYVIDLIPQHDVFITYFSSTIRWALAAGKPVVNYDAYGAQLQTFNAPGFVNARTADDFKRQIAGLTSDRQRFYDLAKQQCHQAPEWGLLDGKCSERICGLIRTLAA
jgi:hypothetical protein